jgi:hypothetical protein
MKIAAGQFRGFSEMTPFVEAQKKNFPAGAPGLDLRILRHSFDLRQGNLLLLPAERTPKR